MWLERLPILRFLVADGVVSCSDFLFGLLDMGAVAEWVGALDWRSGGPGFKSRCGNLFASELWQFRLPPLPVSFGGDTKSPFYLVYMPGEVKDPTIVHWKCVTGRGLHHPLIRHHGPHWK